MQTYEAIKEWKDGNITSFLTSNDSLNQFHDQVMLKVLEVAKRKVSNEAPPCEFTWFITGSGGRMEQGLISDQDHGIIFELSSPENNHYFKALGEEISFGMDCVGYPYCNGKIMSSNPIWCKSLVEWEKQIDSWMENNSWESIRYLQIFFDARSLDGNGNYIHLLKRKIYEYQLEHPALLQRFAANVKHIKNVIGPMGQILTEQKGIYQGFVNLKYAAFLPYVNSIRLLSIKEGIFETSTMERIKKLQEMNHYDQLLQYTDLNFEILTKYRLSLFNAKQYDDTHYLKIKELSKEQRKELKRVFKDGKKIHDTVIEWTVE